MAKTTAPLYKPAHDDQDAKGKKKKGK